MLLSLSAQYASGQSIRDHCLVHSSAEIRRAPVSGRGFDWQLGPGDCVCCELPMNAAQTGEGGVVWEVRVRGVDIQT